MKVKDLSSNTEMMTGIMVPFIDSVRWLKDLQNSMMFTPC